MVIRAFTSQRSSQQMVQVALMPWLRRRRHDSAHLVFCDAFGARLDCDVPWHGRPVGILFRLLRDKSLRAVCPFGLVMYFSDAWKSFDQLQT